MPVFADVDEHTQNLTAVAIGEVLTPRTRAVILVHQGGVPADIAAVRKLCDSWGVAVVEDAACALGSTYRGQPIGSHSDLVVFSFHPRKLITTGEGGMIMTSRLDFAERMRRLREHAMTVSAADRHASLEPITEEYPETGFNYRMQRHSGSGRARPTHASRRWRRAGGSWLTYQERLAGIPGLHVVADTPFGRTNFQSFWIVLPDEFPLTCDELLRKMMECGISARRGFMAAHLQPAYRDARHGELAVTERLTRQSLILPLFHEITEDQQDQVVAIVRESAGHSTRRRDHAR